MEWLEISEISRSLMASTITFECLTLLPVSLMITTHISQCIAAWIGRVTLEMVLV